MIRWAQRARPLEPAALVGPKGALHARFAEIDDARLARLRGVATAHEWIIVGAAEDLPWVEGVVYLARDPLARSLYVPTYLSLDPSAALVERALMRRSASAPWALFGETLVSLAGARVLDRAVMAEAAR